MVRTSGDPLAVATDVWYRVDDLKSCSIDTSREATNAAIARTPIKPSIRECRNGTLGLVISSGGSATGDRVGGVAALGMRRIVTSAQNPNVMTIKTGTNTMSIHPAAWFQAALGNSTSRRPSRNNTGHPMSRIRLSIFTAYLPTIQGIWIVTPSVSLSSFRLLCRPDSVSAELQPRLYRLLRTPSPAGRILFARPARV